MAWGVLKSTCRIDASGVPKSTPGLPKSRPGATQNERKFEKIDKVCLQGYLGRASVAPVVDFGRHLGAQGIHGWAFWIAFGGPRAILDVSFSVFLLKLFFNHIFSCFFMVCGAIYVTVFHVGLLHAVSIFRIWFCEGLALFYEVPSASGNLWRSAFYTIKTMVFTHSTFSENLFFV